MGDAVSTVADKLREARALIERGWTQDAEARNADGDDLTTVDWELADTTPVCWCAGGAIFHTKYDSYMTLAAIFRAANGINEIPEWNDAPGRTQAEVLAAFDRAIALAEQEAVTL